jgi:hypothetical protein
MSTSTIFKFPRVTHHHHDGPLGIHIDAYEALLGEQGYSRRSTYVHLHIVADLSRWLKRRRLDVDDVDERTVGRYLQSSRRFVDGYRGASSIPYNFLGMLRDRGIVNHKSMPVAVDACEVAIANFKQYLSQERGLSVSIQGDYSRFAHEFLRERFGTVLSSFRRWPPQMSRTLFDVTLTNAARAVRNTSSVRYEHFCDTCDIRARLLLTLPPACPGWRTGRIQRCPSSCSQDKYSKYLTTAIGAAPWAYATMRSCCCWRDWVCGRAK